MMETVRIRDEERSKAERFHIKLHQANAMLYQLRVLKSKAAEDIAELKGRLQGVAEVVNTLKGENTALRQHNTALQNALTGKPV
ncbi:hypothetical protein IIE18_02805 [Pseudomonas sp. V1]|uniref:hypothetical protein n=1 Tax=Pseudomonas arcuscaelestis TaxID=2710591 RepID=UPI00193FAE87|nr:hypothetical protein [Pseudomonas arcuscaelestis]MBM3104048.1 hypothetical protein [Pseudomonas arcuscaelestis]